MRREGEGGLEEKPGSKLSVGAWVQGRGGCAPSLEHAAAAEGPGPGAVAELNRDRGQVGGAGGCWHSCSSGTSAELRRNTLMQNQTLRWSHAESRGRADGPGLCGIGPHPRRVAQFTF